LFEVASEHLAASGVAPKANGLERKHAELRPEAKPVSGPEIRARSLHGTPNQSAPVENLLTPEQQETLQRNATLLKYRSGNVVFHESEDAHFLYFIVEGVVRISRSGENGRRQILAFSVPGDLFGIPDAGHYVNSAETVCATQVYRVPWPRMQQLMADEPPLQLHLLAKLGYDLRQAQARIMTLGVQTIPQRLASFLLEFALLPNWFDEEQRYLKLPMNRFDMADYLGTAPESTARAFAKLESEGLVRRVSSRTLEILDIGGLENLRKGHVKRRSSRIPITSDCERG
jgi:CRP-like cAMP-binding protein